MAKYASTTTVSVERSRAEIESLLTRYNADQFLFGRDDDMGASVVQFRISSRIVRFILPLPKKNEKRFTHSARGIRSNTDALKHWEQGCRQAWRALLLCVKAKLEAVEAKISTFEDEFMAHIVLPDGRTVGQVMKPQIEQAYIEKKPLSGIAGLLVDARN